MFEIGEKAMLFLHQLQRDNPDKLVVIRRDGFDTIYTCAWFDTNDIVNDYEYAILVDSGYSEWKPLKEVVE